MGWLLLLASLLLAGCRGGPLPSERPAEDAQAASAPPALSRFDAVTFAAAVDALASESLQKGPVVGLSIGVERGGEVVLAKGYGFADREADVLASADTSYPIASVSKLFTAAAILQLAEKGRLSIDDPLGRFLSEARPPLAEVLLRRLLNHTSGIAARSGPSPKTKALAAVRRGGLRSEPGRDWEYNNAAFAVLGLVVEAVSGMSYADYVAQQLAAPAGLTSTGYCEGRQPVPNRSQDYGIGPQGLAPSTYWHYPKFFAAGGLCSSANDLLRWQRALRAGGVMSAAAAQSMEQPTVLAGGLQVGYGLGTRLGETEGRLKTGHTGGGTSNKAVVARYPAENVTIVVLLNTEASRARVTAMDLEDRIARALFGLPPAGATVARSPAELERYAGAYDEGGSPTRVILDGGTLTLQGGFGRGEVNRLVPEAGDAFATAEDGSDRLRFIMRGERAEAYLRYNEGWFVELGQRVVGSGHARRGGPSSRRRRTGRRSPDPG